MVRKYLVTEDEFASAKVENGNLTFTRDNGQKIVAGELLQGEPGPQGLPGVNAVPADEAVATYASTPGSQTNTALKNTMVDVLEDVENLSGVIGDAVELAIDNAGVMYDAAAPVLATNVIPNPGFEQAIGTGISGGGATTVSRDNARAYRGDWSLKVAVTGAGAYMTTKIITTEAVAGQKFTGAARIYNPATNTGHRVGILFNGTAFASDRAGSGATLRDHWAYAEHTVTAEQAGTVIMRVYMLGAQSGDELWIDDMGCAFGDVPVTGSGDDPGWRWAGEPGNSPSEQMMVDASGLEALRRSSAPRLPAPKFPLTVPTPDGNPNAAHPSVVFLPDGWNGYRYWMAYTPFPNEPRENPCIVASNDKVTWVVPDGATNPVTSFASIQGEGWDYNSDAELVHDAALNALVMFERPANASGETIRRRVSWDGRTWTAPVAVLTLSSTDGNRKALSPAVVVEDDGSYTMWTVNRTAARGSEVERRTSTDGITFGSPTTCTIPTSSGSGEVWPWHLHVRKAGGTYHMLMNTRDPFALAYWVSEDGVTWRIGGPLIPRSGRHEDAQGFYRSAIVPIPGDPIRFDVYATIINGDDLDVLNNNQWRIALLENVSLSEGIRKERLVLQTLPAAMFSAGLNTPTQTVVNSRYPAWVLRDGSSTVGVTTTLSLRGQQRVRVKVVWANLSAASGDVVLSVQSNQAEPGDTPGSTIDRPDVTATAGVQDAIVVTDCGELPVRPGASGYGVDVVNLRVLRKAAASADTLAGDIALISVIIEQP